MHDITDEDIAYAERLILPAGAAFNDERRSFIRSMDSRDVVACPGSGKTTALLAKLAILARKLPFADGRGICVLTHTNVAMDEIKRRAGDASVSLFRYPNFFGTIQSFVNQFLAVPYYRNAYGTPIIAIDNDRFRNELERLYARSPMAWLEKRGGADALGRYWFHPDTLELGKDLDNPIEGLGLATPTYKRLVAIRKQILEMGVLSFHDAYSLALRYIKNAPLVARAIASRFSMVFLDEAQDTDEHQLRVLDGLFDPSSLTIQRVGDPNQAIFGYDVKEKPYWQPRDPLYFSDSQRFGPAIARLLNTVRVETAIELAGCEAVPTLPPHILSFAPGEENSVIRAFSRLVRQAAKPLPSNPIVKAVGWIGKDNTEGKKLCIPSYYPLYDRSVKEPSRRFTTLISYMACAIGVAPVEGPKRFFEIVLQGVSQILDNAGAKDQLAGRRFSPISAEAYWRRTYAESYSRFRELLAKRFLESANLGCDPVVLRDGVVSLVAQAWSLPKVGSPFLDSAEIEPVLGVAISAGGPQNSLDYGDGFRVQVGTVHSVKGETHSATLYLETEYYGETDAVRLMQSLEGKSLMKRGIGVRVQQNLKVAHVAFSRPTHLLAFACRVSSIAGHEQSLAGNGWTIRTVAELLAAQARA